MTDSLCADLLIEMDAYRFAGVDPTQGEKNVWGSVAGPFIPTSGAQAARGCWGDYHLRSEEL